MGAVYGVGGESDATDIALFFVALYHPVSLSLENQWDLLGDANETDEKIAAEKERLETETASLQQAQSEEALWTAMVEFVLLPASPGTAPHSVQVCLPYNPCGAGPGEGLRGLTNGRDGNRIRV